jgi:hypothetical protein
MAQAARSTASSSLLTHSTDVSSSLLSEDVSSLLQWGRHVLQQERGQRRVSSHPTSHPCPKIAVTAVTPPASANGSPKLFTGAPRHVQGAVKSDPSLPVSIPPLYTQQSVQELRARLSQLQALEADNTRAFEQRWSLLQRGRERFLRVRNGVAAAQREHHVERLMSLAQAIVEGEDVVCDTLREVVSRLEQCQRQQEAADPHRKKTTSLPTTNTVSVDTAARSGEEGRAEDTVQLLDLVRAIEQHVEVIVHTCTRQRAQRAEEERRTQAALRQRAENLELQRRQLTRLQDQLQQLSALEQQRRHEVANLKAQHAARAHAVALQNVTERRRRVHNEALQRLARLHDDATLRSAVARQELAVSEARYKETQTAYSMAQREYEMTEEQLRDTRTLHRRAQQRRQDAEAEVHALRHALAVVHQQCADLRARRLACEEDAEALEEAMRSPRRLRHLDASSWPPSSVEWCAMKNGVYNPDEHLAALQRELPALKAELRACEERRRALLEKNTQLRACLEQERSQVAALQMQKTTLEAHLVAEKPSKLQQ